MHNIEILGRKYNIFYTEDEKELQEGNEAEVNYSKRTITVLTRRNEEQYSKEWIKDGLIHEIAHAFMYESGQVDLNDERHAELLCKFVAFIDSKLD